MTTISQAKSTITQGIYTKSKDLLILENSTIRQITTAYTVARDEVAVELQQRWNMYTAGLGRMTEKQVLVAQTKLFRDAQLYENLEARIAELGGKVDKITASAIMESSGISNEWVKREFEAMCAFTNLDPASFALINQFQAEVAIKKVNKGTKFINDIVKRDTLKEMRQQMRIGLLKGESIDTITQRLVSKTPLTLEGVHKGVFSSIEQRARLNARWGVIESANSAATTQYGSFNARVSKAGMKEMQVMKQVTAMVDQRTSETCIYANGQIQPVEKPFETDQGNLDYPPFHCNCRTTVTAWHKAFEAYGKSTKDMIAESKAEAKKRGKKWTKKNKGKVKTRKQVKARKQQIKAQKKAMKASADTKPPNMQMPTQEVQKAIKELEPKDAIKILKIPTKIGRKKALKKYK